MEKRKSPNAFIVVLPGEIIEIPQNSDKSWLTLFYSLPKSGNPPMSCLWNKGRTSIQGQALYVRSARQAARRTIEVQVVLRHFVPNKGQHPLRRYAAIHSVLTVNRRLCKCGRYLWTNTRKACRVKKFTA